MLEDSWIGIVDGMMRFIGCRGLSVSSHPKAPKTLDTATIPFTINSTTILELNKYLL